MLLSRASVRWVRASLPLARVSERLRHVPGGDAGPPAEGAIEAGRALTSSTSTDSPTGVLAVSRADLTQFGLGYPTFSMDVVSAGTFHVR
jgi:hypothetical protein